MDQAFTAASHHDILVLLVQLAVLLFSARILGEIAQRLGQPTVVGEILAGIILGPSLISGIFPAIGEWMIPHTPVQGYLLEVVSMLGVMFLLLVTGLETDIPLIRGQARAALGVALGGLLLPLALGFALGIVIPDNLLVDPEARIVFALFIATAMSISAIPVVAKVLMDLNLMRRDIGQTVIAAAMIDDTTGWVLLSVVIGLATGSALTVGGVLQSVGTVVVFMVVSFTAGNWLVRRSLRFAQNSLQLPDKILTLVVFFMFAWGAISQAIGLEALLGAFVIGIVFSQMNQLSSDVLHKLESIALSIFSPIFFAVAGLKINIVRLFEPELLIITIVVIVVATIGKIVGIYIGSRMLGGSDHWTALFYGAGLNARGSMGIIVATIGLSLNVLSQDMFSAIVVMSVITSLIAPAMLRWTVQHIVPDAKELDRLRREELNQASLIANVRRVLLPVRMREDSSPAQLIEAKVLERIHASSDLTLTLMTVCTEEERAKSAAFLDKLGTLFAAENVVKKVVIGSGEQVGKLILDEAKRDYDLMIMGASEESKESDTLFNPLVDYVIRSAPCPTMLVRGQRVQEDWFPEHILVPSNGSLASRRAAEVAFAIANGGEEKVTILRVIEQNLSDHHLDASGTVVHRQKLVAQESVEKLQELGKLQGVDAQGIVREGVEPEGVILEMARDAGMNMIILGTHISIGTDRLYLGPRVERLLKNAVCPVIVINS